MNNQNIYIIGIGGAGTSALARLYQSQGHNISGSDDGDGFYTKSLKKESIKIFNSFDKKNIPEKIDFAVHSTAFNETNSEIAEIKNRGIKLFSYPEALGKITKKYFTIAVCGTHGKTTTTAMTTHTLIACEKNPTAIVGAPVIGWETSGFRKGGKEFLVIEADEYQNKLAFYHPTAVILTSIDFDHPDFFKDFDEYKKVFTDFIKRIPKHGFLVACANDKDVLEIIKNAECQVITYGTENNADAQIINREIVGNKQEVVFKYKEKNYTITINSFGLHNALNALGAWLTAFSLTGNAELSSQGISEFVGTKRRFERKGLYKNALLFDDYAHHPEEIRATLSSLREAFPKKNIVAAFHPHTFSRTKALLNEFARTLDLADRVIILDIYGSVREEHGGVSAQDLVDEINQDIQKKAVNLKDVDELANFMKNNLTENDVFITLGAGDIYKVYDKI
ncbi:MAG: UDP-N-acetylmuramate--L-alanine ligase [Candidatus Moranbacteria bacterium]|nr:UDP-N-acetylmuramate--L-alanine ligase [Candidatus Moranbacteria bacterium]